MDINDPLHVESSGPTKLTEPGFDGKLTTRGRLGKLGSVGVVILFLGLSSLTFSVRTGQDRHRTETHK